ncbi:MAG TPA: BsuPI-related putative proteinase inhibitor [Longimicrobiales bacterium]
MTATSLTPAITLLLLVGCARTDMPTPSDDESPQRALSVDGISYSAETRVQETFPVTLRTEATLTNTTNERRTVNLPGGCPVTLRAYRDANRSAPPAWDQAKDLICTMQLAIVELDPGESRRFSTSVSAAEILGDSLPPGDYHLTAVLRPDNRVVEVPAGSATLDR